MVGNARLSMWICGQRLAGLESNLPTPDCLSPSPTNRKTSEISNLPQFASIIYFTSTLIPNPKLSKENPKINCCPCARKVAKHKLKRNPNLRFHKLDISAVLQPVWKMHVAITSHWIEKAPNVQNWKWSRSETSQLKTFWTFHHLAIQHRLGPGQSGPGARVQGPTVRRYFLGSFFQCVALLIRRFLHQRQVNK